MGNYSSSLLITNVDLASTTYKIEINQENYKKQFRATAQ
jgi:hypothetical protein